MVSARGNVLSVILPGHTRQIGPPKRPGRSEIGEGEVERVRSHSDSLAVAVAPALAADSKPPSCLRCGVASRPPTDRLAERIHLGQGAERAAPVGCEEIKPDAGEPEATEAAGEE